MARTVTRCSHCKTLFEEKEDHCPGCRRLAPRGMLHLWLKAVACGAFLIAVAVATLASSKPVKTESALVPATRGNSR